MLWHHSIRYCSFWFHFSCPPLLLLVVPERWKVPARDFPSIHSHVCTQTLPLSLSISSLRQAMGPGRGGLPLSDGPGAGYGVVYSMADIATSLGTRLAGRFGPFCAPGMWNLGYGTFCILHFEYSRAMMLLDCWRHTHYNQGFVKAEYTSISRVSDKEQAGKQSEISSSILAPSSVDLCMRKPWGLQITQKDNFFRWQKFIHRQARFRLWSFRYLYWGGFRSQTHRCKSSNYHTLFSEQRNKTTFNRFNNSTLPNHHIPHHNWNHNWRLQEKPVKVAFLKSTNRVSENSLFFVNKRFSDPNAPDINDYGSAHRLPPRRLAPLPHDLPAWSPTMAHVGT